MAVSDSITMTIEYQLTDASGEWMRDEEIIITLKGPVWSVAKAETIGRKMFGHWYLTATVEVVKQYGE